MRALLTAVAIAFLSGCGGGGRQPLADASEASDLLRDMDLDTPDDAGPESSPQPDLPWSDEEGGAPDEVVPEAAVPDDPVGDEASGEDLPRGDEGLDPGPDVAGEEGPLLDSGSEPSDTPHAEAGAPEASDDSPADPDEAVTDAWPADPAAPDPLPPDQGTPDPGLSGLCATKKLDLWSRGAAGVGGTVVFDEVMYHPPGGPALEWVELYNPMAVDMDLSRWRIEGAVRYVFAEGTIVPGRGLVVVAADPAALEAATGFSGALGPWEGELPDSGGDLQLRSNSDRLMDRVEYDDSDPWPLTPDGAGASLLKLDPDGASELAEGWTGSAMSGGSPGLLAPLPEEGANGGAAGLVLNEVAGGGGTFFLELLNAGTGPVELEGYVLSSSGGAEHVLAQGVLAPGEVLVLYEEGLGFGMARGEKLFLLAPDRTAILDGVEIGPTPKARVEGGRGPWLYPDEATPGEPNQVARHFDVVINELMYHDKPEQLAGGVVKASPMEWIELYNRGVEAVDLAGWQLVDDVEFEFPAGTVLPAGGYLVVARNAAGLAALHPGIAVVGDFDGKLDNAGGRVLLLDACGNPADEVRWFDGGRWPSFADGGGSSLELRDPDADNSVPEAWAASDESGGAAWGQYVYEGVAAPSAVGPDGQWREFVMGLLDEGIVLVDDVRVTEDPYGSPVELIQDGGFGTGTPAGWRLLGNHRHSEVVPDPDDPSNPVLRLVATGPTEHMHNHAETTLASGKSVVDGRTYRVSFRARWVAGSNQLHTRLYFNRLARTTLVSRPVTAGTPGAANSVLVDNLGPTYRDFGHSPAVPPAFAPVTVVVTAADPDGVAGVTLRWSVDGGPVQDVAMQDQGGGRFSAEVPGQAAGAIVQFWVEGTDMLGATTAFPAAGPASRALWKVSDGLAGDGGLHDFRIIMTKADADWLHAPENLMSNDHLRATVVYDEREVFYDVGVRAKGSERGRPTQPRFGFGVYFHAEQPFRGVYRSVLIDRSEGIGYGQREMLINQVMAHAGSVSAEYDDLIRLIAPRPEHTGPAELQLSRFGDLMLDAQFKDGGDGMLFEYELVYYPTTTDDGTPEGNKLPQPDLVVGTPLRDLGPDKEAYRFTYIVKNNRWRDDYSGLMGFLSVMGLSGAPFDAQVANVIDVDQWLRSFAMATLSGAIDNYASGAQHNAHFYVRPSDGRVLYFPHDLDFLWGGPNGAVVANNDLKKLIATPAWRRLYYAHLQDVIATSYNTSYLAHWCQHYGALLPGQDFASHCAFVGNRAAWVLDGAPDAVKKVVPPVSFEITTAGGADFTTPAREAELEGTGWLDVREIYRSGIPLPLPVTWTDLSSWRVEVSLGCGANPVVIEARDLRGDLVGTDAVVITSTAPGCP